MTSSLQRRGRHRTALLIVVCHIALLAYAAAQVDDPVRARLARAADAASWPGSSLLVIFDSTNVDVEESGLSRVIMHKLTKVLTTAGAKELRLIPFGYDPLSAAVDVLDVRIHRKDGSVERVPADRVVDYAAPARAIYWGAREKSVEIGHLEPGDAVETIVSRKGFTYALLQNDDDDRFIPPMRGHYYDIVEFWSTVPMLEKVYRIVMPRDKPLQHEVYNGALTSYVHFPPEKEHTVTVVTNPQVRQSGASTSPAFDAVPGKVVYCWSMRDIEPFKGEPGMVAQSDVAPKLLLSTAPDWYSKAVWFHGVNEDFGSFAVTPEVQKMTDSLIHGVTDEMTKISILTHWCAEEIRYSGISMGEGEGYTLHPGGMTFRDRCGVCKDKAGMLITMLRAAGFTSYPAMTMAGSRIDRIPADQFNHSVTLVRRSNGEWMLLDPTWVPGVRELWSSAEQQQGFLAGIPGGADLMVTPVSPADNHLLKLHVDSRLHEDGTLDGELVLEAEGQSDASMRRAFVRSQRSGWHNYVLTAFAAISPRAVVEEQMFQDPDDLSRPMHLRVRFRIPHYALVGDDRIVFVPLAARNPFGDRVLSPELFTDTSLTERKHGFTMRCSKVVDITEKLTLPKFSKISTPQQIRPVRGPAASFAATYSRDGGTLNFTMTHRLEKRLYDAGDWPQVRDGLVERLKLMETPIILTK